MIEFIIAKYSWDVLRNPVRKISPDAEIKCEFREPEYPLLFEFEAHYYDMPEPMFQPHKYWAKDSYKCQGGMLKIKTLQTMNPIIAQIEGEFRYVEEKYWMQYDDHILRNDQSWSGELIGGFLCLSALYYNWKKAEYLNYVDYSTAEKRRLEYEEYRIRQKERWKSEIGSNG